METVPVPVAHLDAIIDRLEVLRDRAPIVGPDRIVDHVIDVRDMVLSVRSGMHPDWIEGRYLKAEHGGGQ